MLFIIIKGDETSEECVSTEICQTQFLDIFLAYLMRDYELLDFGLDSVKSNN